MKILLSLFSVLVLSVAGFAQPQRVLADKIIGIVGDKVILKSDIDNVIADKIRQGQPVMDNERCLQMEQNMAVKAMVLQAEKDSLPVTDEEVEAEIDQRIRYFIGYYGGKDAFEQIAGRTVYQVKEDFRVPVREQKLAQAMRNKIVDNIKITPNEVTFYYNKIPKDSLFFYESELEVRQIVIYPKASRELEKFAQDELLEYKRQVDAGEKTFETLARLHTDDPGSKQTGGRYEVNKNEKNWDPTFLNTAFTLKEGQVSRVIKSKFGYHILQVVSRNGDDAVVRHILKIPIITETEIAEAKTKLDSVRAKILSGSLNFGQAVEKYSDDDASKFTAGAITGKGGNTSMTIQELDKNIVSRLENLKVGEITEPEEFTDERGKKGVRILYLQSRTEPHRENLKDDYKAVSDRALEEKKNDAMEKWFVTKIPTYYIIIDNEFDVCPEMQKWKTPRASAAALENSAPKH